MFVASVIIYCETALTRALVLNPTAKGSLMSLIQGFATHAAGAELLPYKYDPGDLKPNEVEITI